MIQGYSKGRFELFIVVTVIALVALVALDRYTLMAKDARVLRLEIISHHFMTAAANFRSEFLVSNVFNSAENIPKGLLINGKLLYASPQGWPASVSTSVTQGFRPSDEDCYQLWQLLLQNPAQIAVGQFVVDSSQYRVFSRSEACRYLLVDDGAYFDFFPSSGRLLFSAISDESLKH